MIFSGIVVTEFGVINFSGIVRIVWLGHVGAWLEFAVLVEFLFLRMGLAQIFRACCYFLGTPLKFSVPVSVFVFFRVDHVPFLFLFFLCLSDSSALDSCCNGLGVRRLFSSDLSNAY